MVVVFSAEPAFEMRGVGLPSTSSCTGLSTGSFFLSPRLNFHVIVRGLQRLRFDRFEQIMQVLNKKS